MKRFLLQKRTNKVIRAGRPLKVGGRFYKKDETLPIDSPINENGQYNREKGELAERFFKEVELPDWVIERMNAR